MFRSSNASLLRPKWGYVALGVALYGVMLAIIAGVIAVPGAVPLSLFALHAFGFGSFAVVYGMRSTDDANETSGVLTAGADGLTFNGESLATAHNIEQAFVVPARDGCLVRVERRGAARALMLRVPSDADAQSLIRALGKDVAHVAAHMNLASGFVALSKTQQAARILPPFVLVFPLLFAGVSAFGPHMGGQLALSFVVLLVMYILTIALVPMSARIGTDGIVTSWFGKRRYLPFSSIVSAETYDEVVTTKRQLGVRLTLVSGELVRLPTGQSDIAAERAHQLARRIEDARVAGRSGAGAVPVDSLARAGRDVRQWVRGLRGLGAGVFELRKQALPIDALVRVVEDSLAPAVERGAAAIAVMESSDPEIRARVSLVAETSAEPHLRVALIRIAETRDEDALSEVLEGLAAHVATRDVP